MNDSTPASAFVSLSFCPGDRLVDAISRLVSQFCQIVLQDVDISARFHMAAQELTENITKYSSSDRVTLEVEVVEQNQVQILRIRTTNQASPEQLVDVERRLRELKEADDPEAVYDRLIEETALLEGVSGLGLARIRAEGGLDFDYSITGSEVTIVVQAPVSKPPNDPQHAEPTACN